ncbi:MAG: DUF4831 family protein [Prevotella sp.]|nr:DUF4831 family protein [Prevotella sp.]
MKKNFLVLMLLCSAMTMAAQEETKYFLPRTALRFNMLVEKSSYTPGEYCQFAERFFKKSNVETQPTVTYRILSTEIVPYGVPDSTKSFKAKTDYKRNIKLINLDDSGILTSINTEPRRFLAPDKRFRPALKEAPLNPHDYMSQEILSAGSTAKMAELTAQEIYDIRESKNQLARGQADFMPNDGQQLKLMLQQLDTQEAALLQVFEGQTVRDTTEISLAYIPEREITKQILFRFSKHFGLTDANDLSGTPYYFSIEDLHIVPKIQVAADKKNKEKDKNLEGFYVNLPGKIKVNIFKDGNVIASQELFAAQFGQVEMLDEALFSKKLMTSVVLDPVTGNLESIKTDTTD